MTIRRKLQHKDGPSPRIVDIYWVAGILEGEGCFTLGESSKLPRIAYVTTDFDSALRVADLLRANTPRLRKYKTSPESKQVYSVTLTGRRAVGWMFTIYPIMGRRRKARIRGLIAEWAT